MCCVACAVSWATWLLFTGVPALSVVLCVRCPEPLGSRSPVCPLGVLLCVCGVLGHLAAVHQCARVVCCVVCAVSWATWLLFTVVPALCVVLRVQCAGPLDSCSPVCPLGVPCCVCGVLGHCALVRRCLRFVRCFACAASWVAWLLSTGVRDQSFALLVRCPGPLGFCSPVCQLGVLCCFCGVPGHLAPVHRCSRSVRCFVCAVSWATWLLLTNVPARCVVCWVCGVMGHLAPVPRCARSVCYAVCCVCGVACAGRCCGAHTQSIWTAASRSRQGLGTHWARTRSSGRRLFRSHQGLGTLLDAHLSVRTAAVRSRQGLGTIWAARVAGELFSCRGSLRVVRALRVCSTRWPLLLGTCLCALVVVGGVPLWLASWPRVVRRASSGPVALGAPVGFPDALVPFPTPALRAHLNRVPLNSPSETVVQPSSTA